MRNMRHLLFILSLFFISEVKSQDIFDSTSVNTKQSSKHKINSLTKFEQYIKQEVEKSINADEKVILLNLKNTIQWFTYDSTIRSFIHNKCILLTKGKEEYWTATCYLEKASSKGSNRLTFMKSKKTNIPENGELYRIRQTWDSLEFNILLPFAYLIERNGKVGYSTEDYKTGKKIFFYAIDKYKKFFVELDHIDSQKEMSWHHFSNTNINYEFNYSQPSFAVLIYAMELYKSDNLFSGYSIQ